MKVKIASLDGLRGVAAVYVMIYHYQMHQRFGFEPLTRFLDHGYLSVDLFFILSGYVITLADGKLFDHGADAASAKWFIVKRIARIYPLYLVSTLIALFLALALRDSVDTSPVNIAANVLMIQAWGIGDSINGATWSISTEWAAYLLFPLSSLLARVRWSAWPLIAVGFAALCLTASSLADHGGASSNGALDVTAPTTLWPLVRCLGGFVMGCGLRRLTIPAWTNANVACAVAAAVMIVALFAAADLLFVAATAALIACLPYETGFLSRLLTLRPIAWLGKVSYSVYLLHTAFFLLEVRFADYLPLGHDKSRAVTLMLFYVLVIAAAGITYRYIEIPGQRMIRHWLSRTERKIAAVPDRA